MGLGSYVDDAFTKIPYLHPLASSLREAAEYQNFSPVFIFLLTFSLSLGILPREYDEGTIEFLDSLPLSRARIFLVKFLMAFMVVSILPLIETTRFAFLHLLSRNSLDPSFHVNLLLTSLALDIFQIFTLLCFGFLCSFLGRFAWAVAGIVFWLYLLLSDHAPGISVFNVFLVNQPFFEGQHWVIPWKMLFFQLGLSVPILALSLALFKGKGDRWLSFQRNLTHKTAGRVIGAIGILAIVFITVSLIWWVVVRNTQDEAGESQPAFAEWTISQATSQKYTFAYPSNLQNRAMDLLAGADEIHQKVSHFLGTAPTSGDRIHVDLSGAGCESGQAYWKSIRMDLAKTADAQELGAILGHETTHVFIDQISDRRLSDEFNSTRFFHEGLATYLEYRLFSPEEKLQELRSIAAILRSRKEVEIKEFVDDEKLRSKRDLDMVYPIGERFVAALVSVYGDEAVGKLLRAFTRPNAPKGLSGMELWYDVFQAANLDLNRVIDQMFVLLDEDVQKHAQEIETLPRLQGRLISDRYWVGIKPTQTKVDGWEVICRFRQKPKDMKHDYLMPERHLHDTFYIPRSSLSGASFGYQLGLINMKDSRVIYESWVEVPLK